MWLKWPRAGWDVLCVAFCDLTRVEFQTSRVLFRKPGVLTSFSLFLLAGVRRSSLFASVVAGSLAFSCIAAVKLQ